MASLPGSYDIISQSIQLIYNIGIISYRHILPKSEFIILSHDFKRWRTDKIIKL